MPTANLPMQATRQQILDYLRRNSRGTVKELGRLLGLTSTGIRQHLTVLERDGLVEAREERGRVGRPTLVYSLTGKADELFPKAYDRLVSVLLEEMRATAGNEQLFQMLQRVARRLAEPHLETVEGRPLEARVRVAAGVLEEQGCIAEVSEADGEYFIDEYSCPSPSAPSTSSSCASSPAPTPASPAASSAANPPALTACGRRRWQRRTSFRSPTDGSANKQSCNRANMAGACSPDPMSSCLYDCLMLV
jgi:predicted ArsR family transcriptional regulator